MSGLLLLVLAAAAQDRPSSPPPAPTPPEPASPGSSASPGVQGAGGETLPVPATAGIVTGRVVSDRGEPVPGARVSTPAVEGAAIAGPDGTFRLVLPSGTYVLYAEADGFDPTRLEGVTLTAGGEVDTAFELWSSLRGGADVVVTGSVAAGGTAEILAERHAAATVTDAVGATQMARAGDTDAASALRRVTGLTVLGGKYVFVRGLGDRYSATLLNGSSLPSPEPEKRVVPLDLFPTPLLEAVVIQKSFSPDLPAEFGGGVVQIRTRGIPDGPLFSVGVSSGVTGGTTFTSGLQGPRGPSDWLGTGTAWRALPSSIATATDPLKAAGMFSETGYTAEELEAFGEALPNRWAITGRALPPDVGLTLSLGDRWKLGDAAVGGQVGLVYANGWTTEEGSRKVYGSDDAGLQLKRTTTYVETRNTVRLGGALAVGAEWGEDQSVTSTTLINRNSVATAAVYDADDPTTTADTRTSWVDWLEQQLLFEQVRAQVDLGPLRVVPRYAFALATGAEPDRREYTYSLTDDGYSLSQRGGSNDLLYGTLKDRTHDGGLELGVPFSLPGGDAVVKVGAGLVDRVRTASTRRFSYEFHGSDGIDLYLPIEQIVVPENIGAAETGDLGYLELEEVTTNSDDYTADQQLRSGYVLADLPWVDRFRTAVGARIEQSAQRVSTFELFDADREPVDASLTTMDVLPSANVTVGIGPASAPGDMLIRVGYGRTLSRPEFRELSEVPYFDYRTGRLYFGNPDLRRAVIDNVDVRWEWYPGPSDSVSVGGFYKHFADPIESIVAVSAVSGSVGTFANATAATNLGAELDLRQGLGFVGPALARFYVAGNAAWVFSRVDLTGAEGNQTSTVRPLQGQSPWVVNAQVGFDGDGTRTTVTALYNVFGRRIVEVGTSGIPDTYELPVHRVDLVVTQGIGPDWKVRLKGSNLLDWPSRKRTGDEIAEEERGGWSVALGVTWTPLPG